MCWFKSCHNVFQQNLISHILLHCKQKYLAIFDPTCDLPAMFGLLNVPFLKAELPFAVTLIYTVYCQNGEQVSRTVYTYLTLSACLSWSAGMAVAQVIARWSEVCLGPRTRDIIMRMRACPSSCACVLACEMSRSHHFRGIGQYAEQLMDFAEGQPMFSGRGQKPSNKEVLAAIASIKKCRQGSFFKPSAEKPCSCGWHTKAAARKQA